ncbi:MAG: hypothetical protein ISN28_05175 [Ectothiorhodospiraceae bacterium AqS1]|nr:hypothetical protein [Ectothiorhodospiraceae bacterium AqS1]MBF2759644.1 hypothetical protein [Ectothiorhodospiraceae bacterium AqS1]
MSAESSDSISFTIEKTVVGMFDFIPIPGWTWTVDSPGPLWAILFIVNLVLVTVVFLFPFWYVYTLNESTERMERMLMESGHRADTFEEEEAKSCPLG